MPLPDLVPDVEEFDAAVEVVLKRLAKRESRKRSEVLDSQGGLTLFLRRWAGGGTTFDTAAKLVRRFELQDDVGKPSKLEDKYKTVDEAFDEITDEISSSVTGPLNRASKLAQTGGIYLVGWNGSEFGLLFYADPDEVKTLKRRYRKEKSAESAHSDNLAVTVCIRDALSYLRQVDIEFGGENNYTYLESASDLLTGCGIPTDDIDLAIKNYAHYPDKAKKYLYGPSGRGSNKGAVSELIDLLHDYLKEISMGSKVAEHISYKGAVYTAVGQDVAREIQAYTLPEDMKGVDVCRESDLDDKKPIEEQKYCVYESKKGGGKGRLRGRFKTKKEALQHKVMMISRYWSGKGKNNKNKPSNK